MQRFDHDDLPGRRTRAFPPTCRIRFAPFVVQVEGGRIGRSGTRSGGDDVYSDPMMASILYRLEAGEAEQDLARRRLVLAHPSRTRRPSIWARARLLWWRGSSRADIERA